MNTLNAEADVQVSEMQLPTNKRSRLASAIFASLNFAGEFTDLLIHEGQQIRLKSAKGLVLLGSLGFPGSNLVVTLEDIKSFFTYYVDDCQTTVQVAQHWDEVVAPVFKSKGAINRSLKTPRDEFIRFSLFQHNRGKTAMVMRVTKPPKPLDQIRLHPKIQERLRDNPRGLLVITGPTASGKTATALSILDWMNKNTQGHIATVEDPIEFPMPDEGCVFTQREVGVDVDTFGSGLRDAMRHAPDAILAGEVRDRDTAEAAILGGESGALMIVTTHGRSIAGALRKMLTLTGEQSEAMRAVLAGSLIGVMRQELIPTARGDRYIMVHDTLLATDETRPMIEKNDWTMLEMITQERRASTSFVSMKVAVREHVEQKTIKFDVAEATLGAR